MTMRAIDTKCPEVMFVQSALDEIKNTHPTAHVVLTEFYQRFAPELDTRTLHEKLNKVRGNV